MGRHAKAAGKSAVVKIGRRRMHRAMQRLDYWYDAMLSADLRVDDEDVRDGEEGGEARPQLNGHRAAPLSDMEVPAWVLACSGTC